MVEEVAELKAGGIGRGIPEDLQISNLMVLLVSVGQVR